MYLGSDAIALAPFTNRVTYLEDGDWVVLTRERLEIFDSGHRPVERAITHTQGSNLLADKGGHRHFMAKEIAEQPDVVGHTLAEYLDFAQGQVRPPEGLDFARSSGSPSPPAARPSSPGWSRKYWFERWRGCRSRPISRRSSATARRRCPSDGLAIVISQSGETADTLAALRYCRSRASRRPASSTWRSRPSRANAT
jgi:glutamine---fructose-6-phosphate transaminase (isomerizing)